MSNDLISPTFAVLLGLIMGYLFARKFFFKTQNLVRTPGEISAIHVEKIGDIWSPEVNISYAFAYGVNTYEGSDYLSLSHFLGDEKFLLVDKHGFPQLLTPFVELAGDEHIETYLMARKKYITIEFDPEILPASRISRPATKKNLFENIFVDFPWNSSR